METMNIKKYGIKLVREKTYKYETEGPIVSKDTVANFFSNIMNLEDSAEESFNMLCLDTKNHVIGVFEVSRGTINASVVHPRECFKRAISCNANALIFAHNHPSGDSSPSKEDIEITRRLEKVGNILGIKVLDHLIIGYGTHTSLKEMGYI